jgi:hypothetical protein
VKHLKSFGDSADGTHPRQIIDEGPSDVRVPLVDMFERVRRRDFSPVDPGTLTWAHGSDLAAVVVSAVLRNF